MILSFNFISAEASANFHILFYLSFCPPLIIPGDSEKVYSVPLNQIISKRIDGILDIDGLKVTEDIYGALAYAEFTVESVDVDVYRNVKGSVDKWKHNGGKLCLWRNDSGSDAYK